MKKLEIIIFTILVFTFAAYANHGINVKIGVLIPNQNSDLWEINRSNLAFNKADMVDIYYGAEYEFLFSKYFTLSVEGGVYNQEVYTAYRDWEYDDGSPIQQTLSLRITSIEMAFKLYPIGHRRGFYPYIAGGPGVYFWKYEQWGDFIDTVEGTVEFGYADTSRVALGFHGKAGLVFRVGRNTGLSIEGRYMYLKDNLSDLFVDFEEFDMSAFSFNIGLHFFLW